MRELHLFAGIGGGILGGMLCGHTPVCAVEVSEFCRRVLLQRQRDGRLPKFPIWSDIKSFDGKPWRGHVDAICGGFPCTDLSCAKRNAAGIFGPQSSLWFEMLRIVREVRPRYVLVENSPMLVSRGLCTVLEGLAESRYNAEWMVLSASDIGAPHIRERLWILAQQQEEKDDPDAAGGRGDAIAFQEGIRTKISVPRWNWDSRLLDACKFWESGQPGICRMDDGISTFVEQFRAIGNAQVPLCAAAAWKVLYNRINADGRV